MVIAAPGGWTYEDQYYQYAYQKIEHFLNTRIYTLIDDYYFTQFFFSCKKIDRSGVSSALSSNTVIILPPSPGTITRAVLLFGGKLQSVETQPGRQTHAGHQVVNHD